MGSAMTAGIIIAAVIIFAGVKARVRNPRNYTTMRCPTCGEVARIYGKSWECTWCGDFGTIDGK